MAISSYSHTLHDSTAFTLIQKNDGIFNMAWKIPAGRVAAATTFSFALIEALFATLLTALSSPLYIIDGRPFKSFSSETLDASKTAMLATKRFVGLESPDPKRPVQVAPKAAPRSLEPKEPSLLSKASNFALSNPNALFVVSALTAAAAGLYFFGVPSYFMNETVPAPTPTPESAVWDPSFQNFTNTSNICDAPIPTPAYEPTLLRNGTQLVNNFMNTSNACFSPEEESMLEPIPDRLGRQLAFVTQHKLATGENLLSQHKLSL